MSADKRALDDLDALFRAVPAKAVSASRPAKKLRHGGDKAASQGSSSAVLTHSGPGSRGQQPDHVRGGGKWKRSVGPGHLGNAAEPAVSEMALADDSQRTYTRLPPTLLPLGLRSAPPAPRWNSGAIGTASATRLTEFVRGVMGARGQRAAGLAIESRLQRKVVHLENVSAQAEAQSAAVRAARAAGRAAQGLSGKQCKRKGLHLLKARDGGKLSFRDLLGLHDLWKEYAARVVSQCGSNQKQLQQRILSADLQGCFVRVSRAAAPSLVNVAGIVARETANTFELVTPEGKTKLVPKRGCDLRLAFGGLVVNLAGGALKGRRGGMAARGQQSATGPDDRTSFLRTAAL